MAYPLRGDLQQREDAHQNNFKEPHMAYHLRGDLCKKGKTLIILQHAPNPN